MKTWLSIVRFKEGQCSSPAPVWPVSPRRPIFKIAAPRSRWWRRATALAGVYGRFAMNGPMDNMPRPEAI